MWCDKKILAIIPARGGSKRIPRKNLRQINGRSLLAHTIACALKSKWIDRLIVSSEDSEIIEEAQSHGAEVPFIRPKELANDEASGIVPILHALDHLPNYDYVVLLQVTSPLRTTEDIDDCIQFCINRKAPACVSIALSDSNPELMFRLKKNDMLDPLFDGKIPYRKQDMMETYTLNGAIYVAETVWFKQHQQFISPETIGYIMPKERSLDIDTEFDLECATLLLQRQENTNAKNPCLIFIFSYAPSLWDAKRYGFDELKKMGIHFKVFDLSSLVSTRKYTESVPYEANIKISSYHALEEQIKKWHHNAIFIDTINGLNGFRWQGKKIFRLFKKYHVKYYLVEIGSLPVIGAKTKIIDKIKKAAHLSKLFAFLKWKLGKGIVNLQSKYFNWYQLPEKIFVGDTDQLDAYFKKYAYSKSRKQHFNKTIVRSIHSFDYDRYLNYKRHHPQLISKKTAVFLDQALPFHPDLGHSVRFSPVTAPHYFRSLNQFFTTLERETNLEVIIAASPRAKENELLTVFGDRRVFKNQTLELVAESALVLMHSSTAVSFAVLFEKPILILKTFEMLSAYGYNNFLDQMADALELKPICIDDQNSIEALDFKNYLSWKNQYETYKSKYVQTRGLKDKTTWEIVANEFLQSFSQPIKESPHDG